MIDTLASALRLVAAGFAVFPVGADKKPLVRGWTTGAATNAGEAARLWQRFPDAPAVGVSTGQSDVLVVDVDPRNGGWESIGRFRREHGDNWRRTVRAATPRDGEHDYFKGGGSLLSKNGALAPGIDTKAHGGFVVAPVSQTEHGPYRWVDGYSPWEIAMQPVPDWLAEAIGTARARARVARARVRDSETEQVRDIPYLLGFPDLLLSDGRLRAIATDEPVMRFLASTLGIPDVPLGTAFLDVLREERHPSAALYPDRDGVIMYHDFHAVGSPLEWLTLAEVFAGQMTGKVQKLSNASPSHAAWFIRLLVEARLIDPAPVPMRPLPTGASSSLRRVYAGVRLLFGCKWRYTPNAPTPLSWRFVADWCGVSQETVGAAIRTLIAEQIIHQVGSYRTHGQEMALFVPTACPEGDRDDAY